LLPWETALAGGTLFMTPQNSSMVVKRAMRFKLLIQPLTALLLDTGAAVLLSYHKTHAVSSLCCCSAVVAVG
jgi:hypothetical protein